MDEIQMHRGADTGYRNSTSGLTKQCEKETRTRYGWTLDKSPIGYTPSRKHWQSDKRRLKSNGFLNTNYVWIDDRKVQVL